MQRDCVMMNNDHSSTGFLTKSEKDFEDFNSSAIYQTFTYQTRLARQNESFLALDDYALLYGTIERSLFKDLKKYHLNCLKQSYLGCFGITARQFNAIRISLEGKIESAKQSLIANITGLTEKITALRKKLPKIRNPQVKHEKGRKLVRMQENLKILEETLKNDDFSICFGGKKLFHAQFSLEENGYASHEEWLVDWQSARNSEFFCLGSKDETRSE